MTVTEIVVSAGRTFNHPYESYSNLRPQVTIKASLQDGEDVDAATKQLQAKAESLVEDHKRNLLNQITELYHLSEARQELVNLESGLKRAQDRISELRQQNPQLANGAEQQPELPI